MDFDSLRGHAQIKPRVFLAAHAAKVTPPLSCPPPLSEAHATSSPEHGTGRLLTAAWDSHSRCACYQGGQLRLVFDVRAFEKRQLENAKRREAVFFYLAC